jgi:endonuclease YncB( thermonuclease family)
MLYEYKCDVVRVIDGDTVVVNIDLGFDTWLFDQHIRIQHIDTPEVRTRNLEEKEKGLDAKARAEELLPVGSTQYLVSRSYDSNTGKYGRIVGDFLLIYPKEGNNANYKRYYSEIMLLEGHAEEYK